MGPRDKPNILQKVKGSLKLVKKTQKGSRCIILLALNLGAIWWQAVNTTSRPFYPRARPPRAGMEECGEKKFFCPHRDSNPKPLGIL